MNYLSFCAIVRNEGKYLEEWLTYHKALGVEHFYIYNNNIETFNQNDGTIDVCRKFKEVELIPWPGEVQQPAAYMHCLNTFRHASRWLGFLDIDEFYVPFTTDNLQTLLKDYERYACLCTHWRIFGSSNQKYAAPGGVLSRFTRCASDIDLHVKSIIDPSKTFRWVTAHRFTHSTPAVDEHKNPIGNVESRPSPATTDIIQINHYVTKSFEECSERRGRLRADLNAQHKMPEFFEGHDRNEVEDLRALNLYKKLCSNGK